MKPLNLDNSPCSPISSNCVIWQGPDISCINLCAGDSVSDVVYKLATELCTIMDQLDLTNLDLSCLKLAPNSPADFSELMQILIDRICAAGTGSTGPAAITDPCPTNCIVPIADCFKTSATQTTMLLLDYVQMIGEKVCSLVDQIDEINNSITNIDNRLTIVEAAVEDIPEPYVLPGFAPDCKLAEDVPAGVEKQLDVILEALVNDDTYGYCALISSTGKPGEIVFAKNSQTVVGTDCALSDPALTLDQKFLSLWKTNPANLSESFIDLWLVIKDLRNAYKKYSIVAGNSKVVITSTSTPGTCGTDVAYTISAKDTTVTAGDNITVTPDTTDPLNTIYTVAGKDTIVQQGVNTTVTSSPPVAGVTTYTVAAKGVTGLATSSITTTVDSTGSSHVVSARVNDTGWVDLLGFSWFVGSPNYKPQCRRIGNVIHFKGALMIPLSDSAGNVINYTYDNIDSYATIARTTPYTGAGGVTVDDNGAIAFNRDNSVIPTSVCNTSFDTFISSNYITASRYFVFNNAAGNSSGYTGILHTVCKIFIFSDGRIRLQLLYDNEYSPAGSASNPGGTSALNTLVSRVKLGDRSPRWYNDPIDNTWTGSPNFHGSDTMSGSTDTTNVSVTVTNPVGGAATGSVTLPNYREIYYSDALRFPFDCDARLASQLGGFGWIQLDGLITTVAPCNTDIHTTTCP